MEGLGNKLKQARENAGYGQKDVEILTGINYKTLSNYENDRSEPDVEKLALLCKVYGVSADYFITVDVDTTNSKACIDDERTQDHIKKYQSLSETGKDNVDKYTDYILSNEAAQQEESQEVGKKGERTCELTSPQNKNGNKDIVRVAVYDSDGKIVDYDLVTREVYEKLEQLGFTVGQERELRIAQPTDAEVNRAIEDFLRDQKVR